MLLSKSTAQSLGLLVNSRAHYEPLLQYIKDKIEYHKNQLITAESIEVVRKHQGAIEALQRILKLKEEAESVLRNKDMI